MEYKKIKGVKHFIYDDIQEFNDAIKDTNVIKDWREGKEGDWVYSDDNRITQLLKVSEKLKHPNDRPNYSYSKGYVRTIVGTFLRNDKTQMDTNFEEHPNRYTFSKKIKNTNSRVRERENPTNKEKLFATTVAVGTDAVKAYMEAFEEVDRDKARKKAVILLKQRRVMEEIQKSVTDVAESLGIDHEYVLRSLKHLADFSEDENTQLQSIKELRKAVGTLGVGTKTIQTGVVGMFQGFSTEQLHGARRELTQGKEIK